MSGVFDEITLPGKAKEVGKKGKVIPFWISHKDGSINYGPKQHKKDRRDREHTGVTSVEAASEIVYRVNKKKGLI